MTEWKQERPNWCPHQDCIFKIRTQDAMCVGELQAPKDHGGVANTHRWCQRGAPDDGEWLHSVAFNRGDAWTVIRVFEAVFKFELYRGPPLRRTVDQPGE